MFNLQLWLLVVFFHTIQFHSSLYWIHISSQNILSFFMVGEQHFQCLSWHTPPSALILFLLALTHPARNILISLEYNSFSLCEYPSSRLRIHQEQKPSLFDVCMCSLTHCLIKYIFLYEWNLSNGHSALGSISTSLRMFNVKRLLSVALTNLSKMPRNGTPKTIVLIGGVSEFPPYVLISRTSTLMWLLEIQSNTFNSPCFSITVCSLAK